MSDSDSLERAGSDAVQTTLEMFGDVPQTFFCPRCGEAHEAGRCPRDG